MKTWGNVLGFTFLVISFGVCIWFLEVRGIRVLMRQYRAQSFPQTEGTILAGEVIRQTGSKGRVYYHPHFLYSYTINGQGYQGGRYRYDGYPSDEASVSQIVASHPIGSSVEVYYNPDDPADTCLAPLVVAQDVSILFLFTPITLIFLFVLLKAGRELDWPGRITPVAGGVKIITETMTTRVRLPRYQPSWLSLITAGIFSVIAGIVIPLGFKYSPVPAGSFALLIILATCVLVYFWQYWRLASGIQDLVIDEGARTVELPLTYKRRERRPLPFAVIKAVTLEKVAHRGKSGVSYTYAPTLEMRDGSSERLTDLSKNRAEAFASWLREKLGTSEPT
jgi:hypothetical protein